MFSEDVSSPFSVWCVTCDILSSHPSLWKSSRKLPLRMCRYVSLTCQCRTISSVPRSRVMGGTGSGKTTFVNLISGSSLGTGSGLKSCTSEVQVSAPFLLDNSQITLIDTPGFDDTVKSDTDVLKLIAAFLSQTYALFPSKPLLPITLS
jgi:predicted GTPase